MVIRLILLVLAFLLFVFAGLGVIWKNVNFGWLGLAALTIALWLHAGAQ